MEQKFISILVKSQAESDIHLDIENEEEYLFWKNKGWRVKHFTTNTYFKPCGTDMGMLHVLITLLLERGEA